MPDERKRPPRPSKLDVSYFENQEHISPIGIRYTTSMSKVFGEESYIQAILDVEAENVKVLSELYPGKVPGRAARRIKAIADTSHVRPAEVRRREAEKTHHELAAVIGVMADKAGKDGRYVHFGMTSADAVETAKALQMLKAIDILIKTAADTRDACLRAALSWKDIPSIARTHGQHAIPAPFGLPFAFFGYCLQKNIERLRYDRERCAEGKLSGVIGTYDVHVNEGIDGPKVEEKVLRNLGVKKAEMAMQTPPREGTAYIISDLAVLCGRLATIASYIKMLKRTEILELSEAPDRGSVGSSAMPHKNMHGNPFIEERCISIGRILRGHALASLESMSVEDFRDLTASLSDRVIIPESFILSDYACALIKNIIERASIVPENIEHNLNRTKGTASSQLVMSRLVDKGMQRQRAREISFNAAEAALKGDISYLEALMEDSEIAGLISEGELRSLCDPRTNLGMSRKIIERIAGKYMNK